MDIEPTPFFAHTHTYVKLLLILVHTHNRPGRVCVYSQLIQSQFFFSLPHYSYLPNSSSKMCSKKKQTETISTGSLLYQILILNSNSMCLCVCVEVVKMKVIIMMMTI